MVDKKQYKVEDGALVEVPIYETHSRGRNWLAIIEPDPQSPNGLKRQFVTNGKGHYYYMVEELKPGIAVEFGADYYTSSGHKQAHRLYGIVVAVTDTFVEFEWYETAKQAIEASKLFTGKAVNPLIGYSTTELIEELNRRGYKVTKDE